MRWPAVPVRQWALSKGGGISSGGAWPILDHLVDCSFRSCRFGVGWTVAVVTLQPCCRTQRWRVQRQRNNVYFTWERCTSGVVPLLVCGLFGLHGADSQPVQRSIAAREAPPPLWLHDVVLHLHQAVQSHQLRRQLIPGFRHSRMAHEGCQGPWCSWIWTLEHNEERTKSGKMRWHLKGALPFPDWCAATIASLRPFTDVFHSWHCVK